MTHINRTPSRRRLPATATAVVTVGAAIAAAADAAPVASLEAAGDDDAELLALCNAFTAEHAVIEAWNAGKVSSRVGEPVNERWWALVTQIEGTPASTWEGVRRKSEVADKAVWALGESDNAVGDLVRYVLAEVATWRASA